MRREGLDVSLSAAKSGVNPALSRNGEAWNGIPPTRTSPVAYLNVSIPVLGRRAAAS